MRYVGVFLEDPVDVPWQVVEYLAAQLGIEDHSCAKRYTDRPKTAYEHAWEIRVASGGTVVGGEPSFRVVTAETPAQSCSDDDRSKPRRAVSA